MPPKRAPRTPATPAEPPAPLWTMDDAAAYLGCNKETVRRMIARGDLRAYRFGPRVVRIDPRDLERARKPIGTARD